MGDTQLAIVDEIQKVLATEDIVAGLADEDQGARVRATFMRLAEPEFRISMVAPESAGGGTSDDRGADGWGRLWEDWAGPFESLRIEIERTIDAGDRVVSLVRQIGRTKTGGVEIEDTSAAVWTINDGKLAAVEFHLDQDAAMRAAGLDPNSK